MCGITGFWTFRSLLHPREVLDAMTDRLEHRGPDSRGIAFDEARGIGLGHRRLSILDLSAEGHQPMRSPSGRYDLVYNGEIYNHGELREGLQSSHPELRFRGGSDTEVLLAAIDILGMEETLQAIAGMFAFALWDRQQRCLHLVRDRLGIKPLYYGVQAGALLFGSELKALRAFPGFSPAIDRQALGDLLRFNSIAAPRSIFEGVFKVMPGQWLTFEAPDQPPRSRYFWDARAVAARGLANPFEGSEHEAVDALEALLLKVIGDRMVADVPLGAFLSGGIDSSTIVALMQAQSERPIKTFSIGYHEGAYNEAAHAAEVALHLGTEHTERYLTPDDAFAVLPDLPTLFDEPFADSSQIPTYLVSKLARESVIVSLSGDGGDELFAGYNRHLWGPRVAAMHRLPYPLRRALSRALQAPDPAQIDAAYAAIEAFLPPALKMRLPGEKMQKVATLLGLRDADALYLHLRSNIADPATYIHGIEDHHPPEIAAPSGASAAEAMMFRDQCSYMPDDVLTKVDRASMAVGLEARVPLLDHRLVEFAWSLPLGLKLQKSTTKWVLRQVLYRHVPQSLIDRPKMGFGVPIDSWLRGPLREWAGDLLSPDALRARGYLNPEPVQKLWAEHLSGESNHSHKLWNLLSFQAWLHHDVKTPETARVREAMLA
ncbi:asparagine synthase (glutamine-hydrolyzing) [Bradymonadaceae bacterium TMQ3]|nr:asparagine synthase (glutamine-hydrolyzing) [Bradymonadaceae bacterium TMQ3]TXC74946.1 asparagine synthase (glutamine-hydrolyzing) [Bradymonadales bacterium TMQ1]